MILQATPGIAEQIARAASDFERERTGRLPKSVSVVLAENTLVITLHGALSPAERALAKSAAGAAQVQELHRRLFDDSSESLRQQIKQITGVDVREATVEVETKTGTVVKAFTSGTVVQVFLLAHGVPHGKLERQRVGRPAITEYTRRNERCWSYRERSRKP